jgi:hypothetical protein
LTPEEKFRQVVEMYQAITAAQTAEVRRLYPAATEPAFPRSRLRRALADGLKNQPQSELNLAGAQPRVL